MYLENIHKYLDDMLYRQWPDSDLAQIWGPWNRNWLGIGRHWIRGLDIGPEWWPPESRLARN